ncbi:MAG: hypothetical protein PCALPYG88_6395 [uncultured Paraburkholderia sp.]|uniref:hypothetical protein n=1 Tax=uncultured Paraburkholderia sp. TaxID=1822466 RepID=UPI0025927BFB|nr:hypothetical protein [uncultured Paraburkholderia sp.]CAH2903141.1 MAG: hypothetical protein PCALPYG08_6519 [uncultured Paraburkholderia sp.]CAH2938878.1 MAG: hypothetical protein PCALPYG88_6395 [uncultured Paraburkholderia sp.]
MLNQKNPMVHRDCASWRAAQLAEFHSLADAVCSVIAMIDMKQNEISALRKVVCESARVASRRQPHFMELSETIETVFAATSPYHLGAARSMAEKLQQMLAQAVATLSELPASMTDAQAPPRTLAEKTEKALADVRMTTGVLLRVIADADEEVRTLQAAFLAISVAQPRTGR